MNLNFRQTSNEINDDEKFLKKVGSWIYSMGSLVI